MAPVRPPRLHGELAFDLVKHLGSPERWVRQQAKRLLFEAPKAAAVDAVDLWARGLDAGSPGVERLWLEAAGVREAHEAPDADTLKRLLNAKDARVRAYGARVAGKWSDRLPEAMAGLSKAATDESPRVRLEAVVASTYAPGMEAVQVAMRALEAPRDGFLDYAVRQAARALQPRWGPALAKGELRLEGAAGLAYLKELQGAAPARVHPGAAVYEMGCLPCHQPGGKGLPGVYPPLAGSEWVKGDPGRLVKIVLHGLEGPIQVAGQSYGAGAAAVPMPAMGGLTDEQVADVLSHVREAFGEGAPPVPVDLVRRVRAEAGERSAPWTAGELAR
jgi:mono/diheme cytochrome c family protein